MSEPQQIGRYHILEELGRGAMGTVLRAEDPTIRRQVAIKVIHLNAESPRGEQEVFERSFLREIRSAGVLHHPGIVSIFDAGRQDDLAYIVMELVDGVTLDAMLQSTPPAQPSVLFGIFRQVAAALDYAHDNGIVHRDIKPSNILIDHNNAARIADFGIAKASHSSTMSVGKAALAGTPSYMSPEQIQGLALDGRTDQWSLAVIVYVALTGALPYAAENVAVLLGQIMSVDPPPPSTVNSALGPDIDALMARVFSKDPALRFANCTEFIVAVESACRECAAPREWELPAEIGSPPQPPPTRRRPSAVMIAAVAGGLLVITAAIGWMTHRPDALPAEPQPFTVAPVGDTSPRVTRVPAPVPAPTTQTPAPAAHAGQPASAAPKKTYQVRLVTTPPDAEVTVDSKRELACKSPCSADLTDGTHTLLVQKDGYRTILQNLVVNAEHLEAAVTLNEVTGSLMVQSDPPGAAVALNGKARPEITPATLTLPPGKYKVTLAKAGFAASDFDAVVIADSVREVSVGLAKTAP